MSNTKEHLGSVEPSTPADSTVPTVVPADETSLLVSIVQTTDDAIIAKTSEGIITSWNKGAERLYGYRADEVIGRSASILLPPGLKDNLPDIMERIDRGERGQHYEIKRRRKDGRIIDVSMSISPVIDAEGKVVGASAIAHDITANVCSRKEAEGRLNAASQYARSLIESSLDPLVTISADGKITDVNEATVAVTGVPRDQLIGTDFSNYFTEPEDARSGYQQVFAKGFVTDFPLTIRHRDGRLTYVNYNASVYKDAQGNVLGVFAAARDVTARICAEAELTEQRRRELERLAELERFQRLTVGRELKMVELKKQINELMEENEDLRKRLAQRT